MRPVLLALLLAPRLFAGVEDTPSTTSPLRVSLATVPLTGATDQPFRPREGFPCFVQVTVENRSRDPVPLVMLHVKGGGYFNAYRKPEQEAFNEKSVMASEVAESGDRVIMRVKYNQFLGPGSRGQTGAAGAVGGGRETGWDWVSPQGVLRPGESLQRRLRWLPDSPDGALVMPLEASAVYAPWSPQLAQSVKTRDPVLSIPARPDWTYEVQGDRRNPPETPAFDLVYVPIPSWSRDTPLLDPIIRRIVETKLLAERASSRPVIDPNPMPVKSLLPQLDFAPTTAVYSPVLRAWFLGGSETTAVIQNGRRSVVRSDISDFILGRVVGGGDEAPWKLVLDDDASELEPYLAGMPRETTRGARFAHIMVPATRVLEVVMAASRLGLQVTSGGDVRRLR